MLTPQDIENKVFSVSLRGYSSSEVDDFLQEIVDEFSVIYSENKTLKAQVENLSETVSKYKAMEETLNGALSVAGKSADEITSGASEKADSIIEDAKATANAMISGAEQRIAAESYRLENIKREVELYKKKVISLLDAQLKVLKEYPEPGEFNIEELKESAKRQQMWQRKEDSFLNPENDNVVKDAENFEEEDMDTTADLSKTIMYSKNDVSENIFNEKNTGELPFVSMDDNGNYVVDDNNN